MIEVQGVERYHTQRRQGECVCVCVCVCVSVQCYVLKGSY